MQIIRRLSDLSPALLPWRKAGEKIALVPTMGALHAGHMALIEAGRANADRVVATIFVNPLQFNDPNDLARYPRQEAEDRRKLEDAGCDLLWLPTAEQLYPAGFATAVSVSDISRRWEGEHRPGHFDGVATVVAKLFIATMPDCAIFGEKDFQQLAVIRRMTTDLGLPVDIIGHPTIREKDGLAMSSRNALLGDEERQRAAILPEALETARDAILAGGGVDASLDLAAALLESADFKIDYLVLVDATTLEPLEAPSGDMRLIAAAHIGNVRLIDNISVISATVRD